MKRRLLSGKATSLRTPKEIKQLLLVAAILLITGQIFAVTVNGSVALNTNPDIVSLTLAQARLYNVANLRLVAEIAPISSGQFTFVATALPPGQYYVECELFQPGTVNFYYPKQSNAFTVTANTTLVNLPLL
ncbi:MAG: hypothetical protein Q8M98_01065, partial [Candidatus Cloacimonadaceae bacterium]|nr:hypothetical protein [Candidatus Cloacimonadaceae bacterium]